MTKVKRMAAAVGRITIAIMRPTGQILPVQDITMMFHKDVCIAWFHLGCFHHAGTVFVLETTSEEEQQQQQQQQPVE